MEIEPIVISPSELDVMRQCPLRHSLLYGERWTKSIDDESHPLAFGTLWHSVLEAHYRAVQQRQKGAHLEHGDWRKFDQDAALQAACGQALGVLDGVKDPEVRRLLAWMYEGHLDMWGVDPQWQIVAIEHGGEVELPGPAGFASPISFRLKFKMDLVIKEEGRFWVVDNKSCKDLPNRLNLDLDDQFGLYHWAGNQMGLKIFGTLHNAARKLQLKGDKDGTSPADLANRFRRTPLTRGKKELDTIAFEAWQVAHERYTGLQQVRDMKQLGLDVEAPRHPSPMTCSWKCDWTEACIAGRKGIDIRDYIHRKGYRKDRSRH